MTDLVVEPLGPEHRRDEFCCGVEALDRYLRSLAKQDAKRRVASVYVMCETGSTVVRGYCTLSAYALERPELPGSAVSRLPAHQRLPALLLGRLAIDRSLQGTGHGGWLLADALGTCLGVSERVGALFVVVHASDATVVPFYRRFGFDCLLDHPLHLYLPVETLRLMTPPNR